MGRLEHSLGVATPGRASGFQAFVVCRGDIYRSYFADRVSAPVSYDVLLQKCSR